MTEHEIQRPTCGKILDQRNLGQMLSHGWKNNDTGLYECQDEDMDIPFRSAKMERDSVQWMKKGKRIDLN